MHTNRARARRTLLSAAVLSCLWTLTNPVTAVAQPAEQTQAWNIEAGPLDQALRSLMTQGRLTVSYPAELVAGKTTRGLSGQYTPAQALGRLLADTGIAGEALNGTTFVLRAEPENPPPPHPARLPRSPAPTAEDDRLAEAETLIVTGTRIRGGESPSPLITIGAEHIREEGFTDLGEVIRSIPQNFNGGQNQGVVDGARAGAAGQANSNLTGGSSLNLRGLGPDATLTLLNGRRLSYGAIVHAVDIGAIPVEAVERIEIVADGASAIYGSDAVGGVGNVILQRDYDGVSIGTRYGGATEGGLTTREYTMTAGTTWSSGGLIATYKDASNDPIYARQRDYTAYMFDRANIWPESDLRSALISAHQSIGNAVELRLDALRTERNQIYYPFNTGLTPHYRTFETESTATLVSPGIDVTLDNDWTLQLSAVRGKDSLVYLETRVDIASGTPTPLNHRCLCNEIFSYEANAEGPMFALPGGDARLAVGAGYRRTEFSEGNYLTDVVMYQGREGSRFAYAEIGLPFLGPGSNISGVHRLVANVAARSEDYDSFGSVTTPKLGLIYGPSADVTLKASWGKSFKAPTSYQRHREQAAALVPAAWYSSAFPPGATILELAGGNPNLDAERATTWSASLAIHPQALPGLDAELTWFDIDYTDKVAEPITNRALALSIPNYTSFIIYAPTIQEQERFIAEVDDYINYSGQPYDPANVVAIMYSHDANVARQRVRGIDLSASYRLDVGAGRLTIRGSGSWLDSSQQSTPDEEAYDLAGMIFSPAKISSRLGAVWTQGGWSASGFANYTSGVTSALAAGTREKTGSFTTFDATVRYDTGPREDVWSGWDFALSVQNLLNRDPPLYTPISLANPPYDSTNYSAIGRFLSVSVSKRF